MRDLQSAEFLLCDHNTPKRKDERMKEIQTVYLCDDCAKEKPNALEIIRELEAALAPFAKFGARLMDGRSHVPKSGSWAGLDSGCGHLG